MKKLESYFGKHVYFNSAVHVLVGMGIGMLLTYPVFGAHTMRWGIALLALGILGHAYPYFVKK
ncbi:hypothetical protein HYW46_05105 [Candidatus Daviesbacteria bacterium]|nr:hypothetical protein [Candidatus Daviesbacteria bacterium]